MGAQNQVCDVDERSDLLRATDRNRIACENPITGDEMIRYLQACRTMFDDTTLDDFLSRVFAKDVPLLERPTDSSKNAKKSSRRRLQVADMR